jgi:hypothetical protein
MANSELTHVARRPHRIGVIRLATTLGVGAALIFGLCWLGTFIPLSSPTHAYIGLFTSAEPTSGFALLEGGVWSFLFGALTGAVFAALYNMFARLDRG